MLHSAEMLRCLRDCDVEGIRALWAHVSPHLPQPESDADALASIHMARTQTQPMPFRLRAYSHAWLTERGLPSQLPDNLRPRAQRIYPVIVEGVGIAVSGTAHPEFNDALRRAQSDAVLECYANKTTKTEFVRARMVEATAKFYKYA